MWEQKIRTETGLSLKTFFYHKLSVLKDMVSITKEIEATEVEKLEAVVIEEVIDTLERQISEVVYLREGIQVDEALSSAPLTNLGCESEFAKFDNRVKHSGGSTSVQTHSWKTIVVTNGLLVNSDFENKSNPEKKDKWY